MNEIDYTLTVRVTSNRPIFCLSDIPSLSSPVTSSLCRPRWLLTTVVFPFFNSHDFPVVPDTHSLTLLNCSWPPSKFVPYAEAHGASTCHGSKHSRISGEKAVT